MRIIPLTQRKAAIIDDCDYKLARFKWHYHKTSRRKGYAARNAPKPGKGWIYLHKVIAERMGLKGEIDHRDRNSLNNRRSNLRESTHQQNVANGPLRSNNRTGYIGVSWRRDKQKYRAYIAIGGRQKALGHYKDPKDAARRYNEAAIEHFGEFAALNPV